jgi:predicted Zn-dependent protease
MSARRRFSLLCLVAGSVLVSCSDVSAPSRDNAYEWRRFVVTGTGVDTLSFHWPDSSLPVRIWAEDTLSLPAHLEHAIGQWEAAFLYGEFSAVAVTDSNTADVIVRTGLAPGGGFSTTRFGSLLAPECQGATDIELAASGQEILRPIRVYVDPRLPPATPGVDACLALTTTHELGHALGIFTHSANPADIMYVDPVVSVLSSRDRSTAEVAYHTEATLSLAPR